MSDLDIFTTQYLGRVFYFCLKKTGSEQDAAELAGEISLEVVQALARGKGPEKFDAWLWTLVRNQWARWATKRYYKAPEQVDIWECESSLPAEECIEEELIRAQELEQVRRELAFVRSDYRQILVAHYFEEMSVSEISRRFGIPVGTVKTRLQSSRRILKEGMNMARQFGTRSFNPETIYFSASGNQPSGLPWSAVKRKLPVNILCEANNNPSTVEELSMEMGIAMPYMEEEVELLVNAELLCKLDGGRYLTNFFISPKECQNEINELSCQFAERHCEEIWALAGRALEQAVQSGVRADGVSGMDAQAYFAFLIEQTLEASTLPPEIFEKFQRKDGGSWGFIGKEQGAYCRLPYAYFCNNACDQPSGSRWDGFQCMNTAYGRRPYQYDAPGGDSLEVIKKLAQRHGDKDHSITESRILDKLLEEGFCMRSPEGDIQVAALVFDKGMEEKCRKYYSALPHYQRLQGEMDQYMREVRQIISRYSVPCLKEDFDYYVGMSTELRHLFAMLWKDRGLYTGGNAQFMAFYC